MNVLDFLEEEIGYVKSSDMPEALLKATIQSVNRGLLECDLVGDEDDDDDPRFAEQYDVLEFIVTRDDWNSPVQFVMVSNDSENGDWEYFRTIDECIDEKFYGQDDLTTTYEVTDEEIF